MKGKRISIMIGLMLLLMALAITVHADSAQSQTSNVYCCVQPFGSLPKELKNADGATLVRNDGGATVNFHTIDLAPGAYTLWFTVFNNPGNCSGGCDDEDIVIDNGAGGLNLAQIDAAEIAIVYGGGKVVSHNGRGNFGGRVAVGDQGFGDLLTKWTGGAYGAGGLTNAREAEIHAVIRYHGPVVPANMPAQIDSYEGGCSIASGGNLAEGGYDCIDLDFAVFNPPN